MPSPKPDLGPHLTQEWPLPPAATLGSSVRAKGILLEIRARMPFALRKALEVRLGVLVLRMPEEKAEDFGAAMAIIEPALIGIETLPILPREVEDILSIKTSERHRWLKDGRLPSAGTRTVRLRGRARQITFHVFDPLVVEDLRDRDQASEWREEDIIAAAERRAWRLAQAAELRMRKKAREKAPVSADATVREPERPNLRGWAEFEGDLF